MKLPTTSLSAVARRLRRALRTYGMTGSARRGYALIRSAPGSRRARQEERAFDRRFGVDTAGVVRLEGLAIGGLNREFGVRYQGSNPDAVRRMIRELEIEYEDYVFVDIGSGKGRVMLVASEFPFKHIVGVEFSPELHATAERNIAGYRNPAQRSTSIESVCMDATEYELPLEPLVLYFYNPFLETMMRTVLGRIASSLDRTPRSAYLLFRGDPSMTALIEAANFVRVSHSGHAGPGTAFAWPKSRRVVDS